MTADKNNIYLDYAASTPVRSEVLSAMKPYWSDNFANPQSQHAAGRKAAAAIRQSRQKVADTLSVKPSEIIFTSGATEANSLAIQGVKKAAKKDKNTPHIVFGAGSHPSVMKAHQSEEVTAKVPLRTTGEIDTEELARALTGDTVIVSVEHVNNEIGTIQPLKEVAEVLSESRNDGNDYPIFHVDASQSGMYCDILPHANDLDAMTVNGHKLYGPKGIGCLWVRSGISLSPVLKSSPTRAVGDYQMLRPGTPPVPLIVGFAEALGWAQSNHQKHRRQVSDVRDYAIEEITQLFPSVMINGSSKNRVANNISFSFPDHDHDYLSTKLDRNGVSVATTSACQSDMQKSQVMQALPNAPDQAIRVTTGVNTSKQDIDILVDSLQSVV